MALIEVKDASLYLSQEHYFSKLKAQLSKDLNDVDFDDELDRIDLSNSSDLPDLVRRFLNQIFSTNAEQFFQLMYRIDIPDADMRTMVLGSGLDFDGLADLVLKRELLKLLFREKYSG